MITRKYYTASEDYVIFHTSYAGQPQAYPSKGWTFEPSDFQGSGTPYSPVYSTVEEAIDAAEAWEYEVIEADFANICEG